MPYVLTTRLVAYDAHGTADLTRSTVPIMTYEAVAFDLLTALLDSWSLWESVAPGRGLAWRNRYLALTTNAGRYVPYEHLVERAVIEVGLPPDTAAALFRRWDELLPWPETTSVLSEVATRVRIAVVTNCSTVLARSAVKRIGMDVPVVVTAESAGWYKPDHHPYLDALSQLDHPARTVLFVAGSASDIGGAARVGMDVYWHNRLSLPVGEVVPDHEASSLEPLLRLV